MFYGFYFLRLIYYSRWLALKGHPTNNASHTTDWPSPIAEGTETICWRSGLQKPLGALERARLQPLIAVWVAFRPYPAFRPSTLLFGAQN